MLVLHNEFRALLLDDISATQCAEFLSHIQQGDINRVVTAFIDVMHRAAHSMKSQPRHTINNNKHRRKHASWWSADCQAAKVDK